MLTQKVFSRPQPATCFCESLRSSDGHDLLPVILNVLSSRSFEPFSILGPLRFFGGYFGEHAPWHHVLCRSRVNYNGDFLPRPLSSSSDLWDQVIESSACSSSSSSAKSEMLVLDQPALHLVILFLLGQHHSPSSSGVSKHAGSSASCPSSSLSHDVCSSSSMLLVHLYGQFIPICPCSP